MYEIQGKEIRVSYDPADFTLVVRTKKAEWAFKKEPRIVLKSGEALRFSGAKCTHGAFRSGITDGVQASYAFENGLTALTFVGLDKDTDRLRTEIYLENERDFSVETLEYPTALEFGAGQDCGYTAVPRMQGTLIPAGYEEDFHWQGDHVLKRELIMPFFGQVRGDSGYLAIIDTPFDCLYTMNHDAGGDTEIYPVFMPSLERIGYRRVMLYDFRDGIDYVGMAKAYRRYKEEKGDVTTLREKIARNGSVAKLIGAPIVHEGIAVHIDEKSVYYTPDHEAFCQL